MEDRPEFETLNKYTGMIEGIDDLREATFILSNALQSVLSHPIIQSVMPRPVLLNMAYLSVVSEAFVRPMSQKEFYIRMGLTAGYDLYTLQRIAAQVELSDELPFTHPDAQGNLADLIRQGKVPGMTLVGDITPKETTENKPVEKVELPDNIEQFLSALMSEGRSNDNQIHNEGDGRSQDGDAD